MLNAYRMIVNRDVKDTERLHTSIGMIQDCDAYMRLCLPQYGVVQMVAVHAAQLLGYTTLSRVSECILFQMRSGCLVPLCEILGLDLAQMT